MITIIKRITITTVIALLGLAAMAQDKVSNIRVQQSEEQLIIMYDLTETADIEAQVSFDGGATFSAPLQHVLGSVGKDVSPGRDKVIVWNVYRELGEVDYQNAVVKVIAVEPNIEINTTNPAIIIRNNAEEIQARIEEVGVTEIRYKRFGNETGPTFTLLKSDVYMIIYEDGSRDVFERTSGRQQQSRNTSAQQSSESASQQSRAAMGVHAAFGSGGHIGAGAMLRINLHNLIRLQGSFSYFFPKTTTETIYIVATETTTSMWDFSVNVHFTFHVADKLTIYPLTGFGVYDVTVSTVSTSQTTQISEATASATNVGLNVGGGLDIGLGEKAALNFETKYFVGGGSGRFWPFIGIVFKF